MVISDAISGLWRHKALFARIWQGEVGIIVKGMPKRKNGPQQQTVYSDEQKINSIT